MLPPPQVITDGAKLSTIPIPHNHRKAKWALDMTPKPIKSKMWLTEGLAVLWLKVHRKSILSCS